MIVKNKYNELGAIYENIDNVLNVISENPDFWKEDTTRQEMLCGRGSHKDTESIILRFSSNNIPLVYHNRERFENFIDLIMPVLKKANEFYQYEYFDAHRILIAKLAPNGVIKIHKDKGEGFHISHRVHWSLKTNKEVVFKIDDVILPFEKGKIIEISNLDKHSVINDSDEERLHLIFDCYNNIDEKKTIIRN